MNEIVNEYGSGLFALAEEEKLTVQFLHQVRVLAPLFTDEYVHLLINPDIAKEERVALVGEALAGQVHTYLVNFVKLMTERGLATEIKPCFAEYERLYYETTGIVRVTAESAVALTDDQKARLESKLASHLGHPVEVSYRITPALLGGMRLSYNNKRIDSSVASRLKEIGDRLAGITV